MNLTVTEKDKIFIKNYKKLNKSYISLFIFILIFGYIQMYLVFSKYIPIYISPFKDNLEVQDFIRVGLMRCTGVSFIWIALLIGVLTGNLYTYRKIIKLIDRITAES